MVDSIIFDLDGTLWDSTSIGARVWSEVAMEHGINVEVTADQLKKLYGLPTEVIAKKLFPSIPENVAMDIMEVSCERQCPYIEKTGGILYPKLVETLDRLKQNYKLFIVSNCQEGYIQSFIKAHQLEGYFKDFENPGRTGLPKAENIKLVINRNHLASPIYIGDTSGDAIAAKGAGIPFVFARYGFGEIDYYDTVIDSLEEIIDLQLIK